VAFWHTDFHTTLYFVNQRKYKTQAMQAHALTRTRYFYSLNIIISHPIVYKEGYVHCISCTLRATPGLLIRLSESSSENWLGINVHPTQLMILAIQFPDLIGYKRSSDTTDDSCNPVPRADWVQTFIRHNWWFLLKNPCVLNDLEKLKPS
jgi:hypothetical protein